MAITTCRRTGASRICETVSRADGTRAASAPSRLGEFAALWATVKSMVSVDLPTLSAHTNGCKTLSTSSSAKRSSRTFCGRFSATRPSECRCLSLEKLPKLGDETSHRRSLLPIPRRAAPRREGGGDCLAPAPVETSSWRHVLFLLFKKA